MKLTKGMKKALSLLLSAAMVVTGVNVTTNTAKAADGDVLVTWTGECWAKAKGTGNSKSETDSAAVTAMDNYFGAKQWGTWCTGDADTWGYAANVSFNLPSTKNAVSVKVYGNAAKKATNGVEVGAKIGNDDSTSESATLTAEAGNFIASFPLPSGKENTWVSPKTADVTITKIELIEGTLEKKIEKVEATETQGPAGETKNPASGGSVTQAPADETQAPGETKNPDVTQAPSTGDDMIPVADMPEKGSMSEFCIYVANFADTSWGNQASAGVNDKALVVKKDGTYTLTVTPEADAEGIQVFYLATNLFNGSTTKDFKLTLDKVANGDDEITVDNKYGYMLFGDTDIAKEMRLNVVNPWNYIYDQTDLQTPVTEEQGVDAFGKVVDIKEGQKITVTFTVSGMNKDGELYTYPKAEEKPGEGTPAPAGPTATAPVSSTQPTTPATSSVTSNSTVTATAIVGTQKIKAAKKSVVVAPNKSVKVNFTKTLATGVTQSAVVTASIASKKVVAKATVKNTSAKKGTVTIKAAKKATKGASTTVTLKSTNKDGKAVSAKIKVTIQNKVKKVKAAKKAVTIKKKGKTAKLVLKVTAENKKKATTDAVSIKGAGKKVVSIKSAKASKGKITLTLKGKKKGSKKVAFKVGKKTVKVKVTVKK